MLVQAGRVDQRWGEGVGKIKRRSDEDQRSELTHLQGFKQAFDKEELLQAVDG